jgi:hypothetical protein
MKKNLLLLFVLFQSVLVIAQTFTATTNKNKVGLNEQFSLTFSLNESGDRFVAPNLSNFTVLAGPSSSSSTSMINGRISKETSYSYRLRAKKKGVFTIYPAKIRVKGKELKSNSLSVQVLKSTPKSNSNNSPEAIAKSNVFIELQLSNSKPYVGEQIIAIYKLYFSQEVRSPELLENPTYTGFWHEGYDLGKNYPISEEYIKGKKFQVATLKKLVLTPQRSGKLHIAGMELEVPVAIPTNQRDFFGRRTSRMINIICSTGDKNLQVKALPRDGKPSNFSGAVGSFDFTTKLDRDSIQTNESANLSLRISGTGNLRMIELPAFEIPNDIEAYEPKYKESIKLKNTGLAGYKREEYLLIPRNKGTYKISSVSFSYFNPIKKKYISINSPSYTLSVNGNSAGTSTAVVLNNITKEDVSFIGKDILYIKTALRNYSYTKELYFGSKWFYCLVSIPLFLVLLVFVLVLLSKKSIINLKQIQKGSASKQAIRLLNRSKLDVYTAVENSLQTFMFKKWNLKRAQFNKSEILEVLNVKQVDEALVKDFNKIIEACEMARFTSLQSVDNEQELKAQTIDLLNKLENY